MADEIRANYEELEQVASRFSGQSQSVEEMLQKVRACMEKLADGGWIGRGADAFFAEMEGEVLPAINRLVSALSDAAQTTGQIAQDMQQAEDEASSLFRF